MAYKIEPFKGGFAVKGPVITDAGTEEQVITRHADKDVLEDYVKRLKGA